MNHRYYPDFHFDLKTLITAFKSRELNGFHFRGEMHDFWEMVYALEGKVSVSEDHRVYKLTEGDVIFHKPMEFHRIWVEKGEHARFMVISFEMDSHYVSALGDGIFRLDVEKRELLQEIYHMIEENFNRDFYITRKENPDVIGEKMTYLQFELFLLSLLSSQSTSQSRQFSTGAMHYKRIIDTMNDHIGENLSIDDLAALCNLSVSNMKKIFNKYAGGGVMRHFNRLKVKRAMRLLRTGHSVAEVSDMLGFSSQNYFSVVFKREAGLLPSEYRGSNN